MKLVIYPRTALNSPRNMVKENVEDYVIMHPEKEIYKGWRKNWWLRHATNPRANPPIGGLTHNQLKNALESFNPDGSQYLGGIRDINISDREHEEMWLRRCLIPSEQISEWKIIYIVEELENDSNSHGWFKLVIKNNISGKYSLRSSSMFDRNNNYYQIGKLKKTSQNELWFVQFSKLAADEKFWIKLKSIINRTSPAVNTFPL